MIIQTLGFLGLIGRRIFVLFSKQYKIFFLKIELETNF